MCVCEDGGGKRVRRAATHRCRYRQIEREKTAEGEGKPRQSPRRTCANTASRGDGMCVCVGGGRVGRRERDTYAAAIHYRTTTKE